MKRSKLFLILLIGVLAFSCGVFKPTPPKERVKTEFSQQTFIDNVSDESNAVVATQTNMSAITDSLNAKITTVKWSPPDSLGVQHPEQTQQIELTRTSGVANNIQTTISTDQHTKSKTLVDDKQTEKTDKKTKPPSLGRFILGSFIVVLVLLFLVMMGKSIL